MGKMKAYMMDLQEEADYAIQEGANSAGEVIMHIRNSGMSVCCGGIFNVHVVSTLIIYH